MAKSIKRTKQKTPISTQIQSDLLAQFRSYAVSRGETLTQALERAMRRELAYPPPDCPLAPLPDSPAQSS